MYPGCLLPSLCGECVSYGSGFGMRSFGFGHHSLLGFSNGSRSSNHLAKNRNETKRNETQLGATEWLRRRGLRVPNPNSSGHTTNNWRGFPNSTAFPKGNKITIGAQKWTEEPRHPCILGCPQQRGTKSDLAASAMPSRGPKRGQKCYATPAFSSVANKGEQNQNWLPQPCLLRGPKVGGRAMQPLHSRGSPTKGTKWFPQ